MLITAGPYTTLLENLTLKKHSRANELMENRVFSPGFSRLSTGIHRTLNMCLVSTVIVLCGQIKIVTAIKELTIRLEDQD